VHDNGYAGMWMGGCSSVGNYCFTNVYVGHSRFHDNPGIDIPEQTGNGLFFKDVDGGTIEHCRAYNNGTLNRNAGGGPVGLWALFSKRVVIQFNESYGNKSNNADGGGFDLDGGVTNSIMQYNYSHDNHGAGYLLWEFGDVMLSKGNIVRYNISQNDSQGVQNGFYGGIHLGLNGVRMSDAQIYGNTVYMGRGPGPALVAEGNLENIRVHNNIFMTAGADVIRVRPNNASAVTLQGNNYWNTSGNIRYNWMGTSYFDLGSWRSASQQERLNNEDTGFQVDPRLQAPGQGGTAAYMLRGDSPLIDRGVDLSAIGINPGWRDFYGSTLPQGPRWDIGAHEFNGLPSPPPPPPGNLVINPRFENGETPWQQWWWAPNVTNHFLINDRGPRTGWVKADHWDPNHGALAQYTYGRWGGREDRRGL
jgi:hypothetical protein